MHIRIKRNRSGSTSIQIVTKVKGRNKVVATVGCSSDSEKIERFKSEAEVKLKVLKAQKELNFGVSKREKEVIKLLESGESKLVGPELVLGKIFDKIGFNKLSEPLFKDIVLARLVYPTSKLKTTEYLLQHHGKEIQVDKIYRFLDKLSSTYKEQVEQISFNYTKSILKDIKIVFYDMTTLYFESEDEDDLRKIGFSKDGKFQHPQIMLGLLIGNDGYPIAYDIFEGNTFEGNTLLPAIQSAQKKFGIASPIVVADSALLSKQNIELLEKENYSFIIGARIKNESNPVKEQILKQTASIKDSQLVVIEKSDILRLIVDYSEKRAHKDANNREKGITRLNKLISSGKLSKSAINNRGYNKFLTLDGRISVQLNQEKINSDSLWDGLKGYITNTSLSPEQVIASYKQLWKIERAFRISKTDLRIRPIYHRKRNRIEAHICVAFVAYTVFKEFERLLLENQIKLSPQKAIDLLKTIYQITIFLPDSLKFHSSFVGLGELQKRLLSI